MPKKRHGSDWNYQAEMVAKIKKQFPKIQLIVDVCLCSTLPDGHCRVMDKPKHREALLIDLGKKLESAGADILAPTTWETIQSKI